MKLSFKLLLNIISLSLYFENMIDFVRNFEAMCNPTSKSPTLSAVRLIAIAGGWHQRSKDHEDLIRFSDPFFV